MDRVEVPGREFYLEVMHKFLGLFWVKVKGKGAFQPSVLLGELHGAGPVTPQHQIIFLSFIGQDYYSKKFNRRTKRHTAIEGYLEILNDNPNISR